MLKIQITGTGNQVRPQTGNENTLRLPAPENLQLGTYKIEWPWKVQVGLKWCGLLAPWGRLLDVGDSIVPPTDTWSTLQPLLLRGLSSCPYGR